RPRSSGDAGKIRLTGVRKEILQKRFRFLCVIFDGRNGAGNRSNIACKHLLRPRFNVRRHAFPGRRKPPKKTCFYYLRFLTEQLARDDNFLNFCGASAVSAELHVAKNFSPGIFFNEAVTAVNLYAFIGDADRDFAGKKLCHARFAAEARRFVVCEPRRLIDKQARGFHFRGHVGTLELNRLKFADGFSELFTLLGVVQRRVEGALRHSKAESSDGNSPAIQNSEASGKAFTFGDEKIRRRDAAIGEDNFRGVAGTQPEFVFLLAGSKTGYALFENESA